MSTKHYVGGAALALALGLGGLHPAMAEVTVGGSGDSIELSALNATVEEALMALGKKFPVKYHASEPLSRRLSGTYQGTLEGVVSQALADYSFTIMQKGEGVEVWATGVNEGVTTPSRPVTVPAPARRPAPSQDGQENRGPTVPMPAAATPIIPASSPELTRAFGKDAPPIQMSEDFVRAYVHRANRGNTRRNPAQ